MPVGKNNMDRLERIHHKALRHIAFLSNNPMSRLEHDYTSVAETFSMASVSSSMIASDIVFVYKIMSNHIRCSELKNLFPIYSPNYVLRNRNPFYLEMPTSRQAEANPVYRLTRCYNDISNRLENPLDFSIEINKIAAFIKMLVLVYK